MDAQDSEDQKKSSADMTAFVQNILQQMVPNNVGLHYHDEFDGMGTRINDLEQSINDLRAEMGVEGSPSPLAPSK